MTKEDVKALYERTKKDVICTEMVIADTFPLTSNDPLKRLPENLTPELRQENGFSSSAVHASSPISPLCVVVIEIYIEIILHLLN